MLLKRDKKETGRNSGPAGESEKAQKSWIGTLPFSSISQVPRAPLPLFSISKTSSATGQKHQNN